MSEWIVTNVVNIMTSLGYVGIGLLMFLENLFPPIPSEVIMPLAGFTVQQGRMNFGLAIFAGVVGTMLGAIPWYYIGKVLGEERLKALTDRYGKWLGISGHDIHKACAWFNRYGNRAVFFGRLVPGVRTLISIPAGISQMSIVPFFLYSTIGTTLWVVLLTGAGYLLGENYKLVDRYLGPVSKFVLLSLVLGFAIWVGMRQLSRRDT